MNEKHKNIHYIVRLFDGKGFDPRRALGLNKNFSIEKRESFYAFHDCDFALVASGTATLEGAITNTPMAVIYKTSWASWFIAKLFLNVRFVSIVNILSNDLVVREFLQNNATPQKITKYILSVINQKTTIEYSKIHQLLYKKNIYKNTSSEIIK